MTPIDTTSTAVLRRTWLLVAPRARSRADSRWRWAATTENVLWMLNAATRTATPLNTTRNVRSMPRKSSLMACVCSPVSSAPVMASTPSGNARWTDLARASGSTPSSAATSTWDTRSCPSVRYRRASSSENHTFVAVPALSSSPNTAIPTTVTSTGAGVSTTVLLPIPRPPVRAEALSMTISPGAAGNAPSASEYGLSTSSSIQLPARVGGPSPPSRAPSAPSNWPMPVIEPAARATPSTARTRSTSARSRVPRAAESPEPTSAADRATTSVPAFTVLKRRSNPWAMDSPSMRVPARKATPSTTAEQVASRRRRWARRPEMAIFHMVGPQSPRALRRSSTAEGVGRPVRWSTMRPSARNTTSSA